MAEDGGEDDPDRATGVLTDQERFLPIANVARIMKRGIPTAQVTPLLTALKCHFDSSV